MTEDRPRVLLGAFACAPPGSPTFNGGEDLLGWRILEQVDEFCEVTVLVSDHHQTSLEEAPETDDLYHTRFEFVGLPSPLEPLRRVQGGIQLHAYLWQIQALRKARRLHEEGAFDLFHHLTYANDWMASYPGGLLDVPYVRGPGGGSQTIPSEIAKDRGSSFRLKQGVRTVLQKAFRLDPVFRRGQDRAQRLLVCTQDSLDEYPERWSAKAELFPVSGVDLDDVADDVDEPEEFTVLAAGKLLEIKAFDLALRAFARFAREAEGEFVLVGEGPERERLEALARDLGVADRVRFEGWLDHDEVMTWMARSDVFLFPSTRDGGGTVVVEAMAAGTPVVCLDHGGPGVHVTEQTGFAVEPEDPAAVAEEMAEALARLCDEEDLRKRMGEAARERVADAYTWGALGDRLATIYREAVGGEGDPTRAAEPEADDHVHSARSTDGGEQAVSPKRRGGPSP